MKQSKDSSRKQKVLPDFSKGYVTGNATLKTWVPQETSLDALMNLKEKKKICDDGLVRVSYQTSIDIGEGKNKDSLIPYTFEDSLVYSNIDTFKEIEDGIGLMKKMINGVKNSNLDEGRKEIFEALNTGKKAEFALELLYLEEPKRLNVPQYISEGLIWLENKLKS